MQHCRNVLANSRGAKATRKTPGKAPCAMKELQHDPLDNLLRQWAEQHAPTESDVDRLRQGVAQSVRSNALLDPPPIIRSQRYAWGWGLSCALGAAVAIVAMLAVRTRDARHSQEAFSGGLAGDVPASVF